MSLFLEMFKRLPVKQKYVFKAMSNFGSDTSEGERNLRLLNIFLSPIYRLSMSLFKVYPWNAVLVYSFTKICSTLRIHPSCWLALPREPQQWLQMGSIQILTISAQVGTPSIYQGALLWTGWDLVRSAQSCFFSFLSWVLHILVHWRLAFNPTSSPFALS